MPRLLLECLASLVVDLSMASWYKWSSLYLLHDWVSRNLTPLFIKLPIKSKLDILVSHLLTTHQLIPKHVLFSGTDCFAKYQIYRGVPHADAEEDYRNRCLSKVSMMTSSNGNNFRITGPLCEEFTGHRWIPLTKASEAGLRCFLWSAPEQTIE